MIRTLVALFIATPLASLAAPPTRTLCSDPYAATAPIASAKMYLDGAPLAGATCTIVTKPTGKVPTCTFPQPLGERVYTVGLSAIDTAGAETTITTKKFRTVWAPCSALDRADSSIRCEIKWLPDPPETYSLAACGNTPAADAWKATGGTIFTYKAGKLTGITTKKALRDAKATCNTSQAIVGARIFCQLVGGPQSEVAEVVKQ